jgi:pullulanase/glycogen debranching enzyme
MKIHLICCLPVLLVFVIFFSIVTAVTTSRSQNRYPDYFPELNKFFSAKPMGAYFDSGNTVFRLFAPNATSVKLVAFAKHDDASGKEFSMERDSDGVWEYSFTGEQLGLYYCYRIDGPKDKINMFDSTKVVADPYSKAVVTQNHYSHPGKSIIIDTNYDWEGDTWISSPIRNLVIYEMHVRDMTIHPTSGVEQAGTYLGLTEEGRVGGIDYLLDLGVNAVELLPCQDFGNIEIPYKDSTALGYNNWNPYERNHWGYMTSYFFAPESYYASNGNMTPGDYCGIQEQQVKEFKDMVKALHKKGIAVLMDVVYNHVSQYDLNPFKFIDKKYYFRLDEKGDFLAKSGCGNDFMSERPMARRLIIESIKYWMTEFHIDGFRFDLAYLLDEETCKQIIAEARKINPNVYIIAEPWGDGYGPDYFSRIGWAAWNDKIRNGVKGQNPFDNLGFIFGTWERENNPATIKRYVAGTLVADGGIFQQPEHSINYLESHDDHTFGDFVRIGTKRVKPDERIVDLKNHIKLTEHEMKISKLGALFLLVSQGGVMIHSGQEFARSKVIAKTDAPDSHQGMIDHNSYNKDNETNWINYEHREINRELYDYYKGLIALRKAHPALRQSRREDIHFLECNNEFGLGFWIDKNSSGDRHDILVLMNADPNKKVTFEMPAGKWSLVVNGKRAGVKFLKQGISGEIIVPATTGLVLLKNK